jgi:hypothetical protein
MPDDTEPSFELLNASTRAFAALEQQAEHLADEWHRAMVEELGPEFVELPKGYREASIAIMRRLLAQGVVQLCALRRGERHDPA